MEVQRMQLVDRFTYVIEAVLLLVILGAPVIRFPGVTYAMIWTAALGLLLIFWFVLRRTHAASNPEKKVRKSIGGGRAVLLDFFSNYSSACLVNSLAIISVQRKYKARFEVISVDMNTAAGRAIADFYGARVGSLILFDARGNEVGRGWWPSQKLLAPVLGKLGK